MSTHGNKRKRADEENLIRKTRAKHQDVVKSTKDGDDESIVSDVVMGDPLATVGGITFGGISDRSSPLPARFTAVRPPHATPSGEVASQIRVGIHEESLPGEEHDLMMGEAEQPAQMTEDDVTMTADPDGRIFRSNIHTGSMLASAKRAAITPKKGRPTAGDTRRQASKVGSATVIGHNADTGELVYLSGTNPRASRSRRAPRTSLEDNGNDTNEADSSDSQSDSRAQKGKGKAPVKASARNSTTMATKSAATRSGTNSTRESAAKPPSTKRPPCAVKTAAPSPSTASAVLSSTASFPSATVLPEPLTPYTADQADEALRKADRKRCRAQREEELQEARRSWQGHKMPRNWGLVALPEDDI